MEQEYISFSVSEVAKILRNVLKEEFPIQKFSVRSNSYSGGSSIDIRWENGVSLTSVEKVVKEFEGAGFDGSIDLKYYHTHYLLPNGKIILGRSEGTTNSAGSNPGFKEPLPEGAKEIHLHCDYIFCHREITQEIQEKIGRQIAEFEHYEFKGLDNYDTELREHLNLNTWREVVYRFCRDKDFTTFKGIQRTTETSGRFPNDFFEMVV
jgi:hypothetical protein